MDSSHEDTTIAYETGDDQQQGESLQSVDEILHLEEDNQQSVNTEQSEGDILKINEGTEFRNQSKARFLIKMKEITMSKRNNTVIFTKEKYDKILNIIQGAQFKAQKTREEYQYCRRYAAVTINGSSKLAVLCS